MTVKIKKNLKTILLIIILTVFIIYLMFLYVLPPVINSLKFEHFAEEKIYNKTGIELQIDNLKLNTDYNLSFTINLKKLFLKNKTDKEKLYIENIYLHFNLLNKKKNNIEIDKIYLDKSGLDKVLKDNKKSKNLKNNLNFIPNIDINTIQIKLSEYYHNQNTIIKINNFKTENIKNEITCFFNSEIDSVLLKNKMYVGRRGKIQIYDNIIKIKDFYITFGEADLKLNGYYNLNEKKYNINLTGEKIPVDDLETSLVYALKALKNQKKNFLDNFSDFSGLTSINLHFKDGEVNGEAVFDNLSAKILMFSIPVKFEKFTAYFIEDKINAKAFGKIGDEKVSADFNLNGYKKNKRIIKGTVHSELTNNFTKQYMPLLAIKGTVDAYLNYYIKPGENNINYEARVNKNSDLYYKQANLGFDDKIRRLTANTIKTSDEIIIKNYEYSITDDKTLKKQKILNGKGIFSKDTGKYRPVYLTCKTNSKAPLSIIGSFKEQLDGGFFNGNLKYDFDKKLLTGQFELSDTEYKDFYLNSAQVNADKKKIIINANGTFVDSPFSGYINFENKFSHKLRVYNLNLFLDRYEIKKGYHIHRVKKKIKYPKIHKQPELTIDNLKIKVNHLTKKRISLDNIEIIGSFKNDIINFSIPDMNFAKGILRAKGIYNIKKHSSDINFEANNIDSNTVADVIFNLPNQIQGKANAKLHIKTKNKLDKIDAKAQFEVLEGYLPKLGSTEFMIKNSKLIKKSIKVRLSDIINIDISKAKAFSSDLSGTFDIDNYDIKNVNIFSKQKYLSLFIEGNYNVLKQNGDIIIWGKYNKNEQKKIKVLYIPLSFIMKIIFKPEYTKNLYTLKINKIPDIKAKEEDTEIFKVDLEGNLNSKIKVNLKAIK